MTSRRSIRFGLNYVPSQRWYFCWNDWSREEIARDFDAMAALGIDHVRVMLVWSWFQPNPTTVSQAHLERLRELMTIAEERGISVLLCPLTGWLSGYRFLPPSVDSLDIFQGSAAMRSQIEVYFAAILDAVREYTSFLGLDLGNEINVLAPELPPEIGDTWAAGLVQWLRPRLDGKWIVNGVDHNPWFSGSTFSPRHLVEAYDAVTVHAWPLFTSCLMRGGLADAPSRELSAFLTLVCRHLMAEAGVKKPVWIQEFGCSSLWGNPLDQETYMRSSVENAIQAGATWFTWWCSHDIDPRYRFDPLEYDLGLIDLRNQPKPLAHVYKSLIEDFAAASPREQLTSFAFDRDFQPAFTTREGTWMERNLTTTTWQVFDQYLDAASLARV